MKEHPILFSGPMVAALLAGCKSVTRRMSKQWLKVKAGDRLWVRETSAIISVEYPMVNVARAERMPPGQTLADTDGGLEAYRVEDRARFRWLEERVDSERWSPSIFMPREISRITLVATEDARLERLQDITEEEAVAEGCSATPHESWYEGMKPMLDGTRVRQQSRGLPPSTWTEVRRLAEVNGGNDYDPLAHAAREEFARLWRSLHTKPGERWEDNPEVVRVGAFR